MKLSPSYRPQSYVTRPQPPSALPSPAKTGNPAKTLLVVDDDEAVRQVVVKILSQQGYSVLQAESAREALHLAASTATIDLLVTDFAMPEVDGLELTRRIRATYPRTPVLMVSGSSIPLLRDHTQDLDRFELLAKPFACNELLHKVRLLLDATVPLPRPTPCCDQSAE